MKYEVTLEGRARTVDVTRVESGWQVRVDDGEPRLIAGSRLGGTEWLFDTDGERQRVSLAFEGDRVAELYGSTPLSGTVIDARRAALTAAAGGSEGVIQTAMPGAVVRVLVAEGDAVTEGQVLLVVEAMKMENEFKAPFDGVVASVPVQAGLAVEAGSTLVVLEPAA